MTSRNAVNRRQFIGLSSAGCMGALGLGRLDGVQDRATTASLHIKEYRTLGRTGFEVSDISAGTFNQNPALLHTLLGAGVNYIDTSEYYGGGNEERLIGEVVKRHDRKKLFITDKILVTRDQTKEGILARARACLERLQTDYIDCMMIGAAEDVETLKTPGFHEAMAELKREGRLRFIGVSNHGTRLAKTPKELRDQVLFAAVDDGRFDVLLLIYNFIARDMGEKVLETCAEKKVGATAMKTNPVNHFNYARSAPEELERETEGSSEQYIRELEDETDRFAESHDLKNPAEIRNSAIRFVLGNERVHSVCVSFSNFDEVEAHLRLSGSRVTASDRLALAAYEAKCGSLYCRHGCGICEPECPYEVPVNTIMRYHHYFEAQGREKQAMAEYATLETAKGDRCRDCDGPCETACPYHLPIRGLLTQAHTKISRT